MAKNRVLKIKGVVVNAEKVPLTARETDELNIDRVLLIAARHADAAVVYIYLWQKTREAKAVYNRSADDVNRTPWIAKSLKRIGEELGNMAPTRVREATLVLENLGLILRLPPTGGRQDEEFGRSCQYQLQEPRSIEVVFERGLLGVSNANLCQWLRVIPVDWHAKELLLVLIQRGPNVVPEHVLIDALEVHAGSIEDKRRDLEKRLDKLIAARVVQVHHMPQSDALGVRKRLSVCKGDPSAGAKVENLTF